MAAPTLLLCDLNVDCMLNIFRMLSLEDLTRIADVCRQFRHLAAEVFQYQWKNQTIRLSNNNWNSRLKSTAILRNFGGQLQKVQVVFNKDGNDTLFTLIIEKCSSQLKQVNFYSTCFDVELKKVLSKANIQLFNAKFQNLETLIFEETTDDITEPECIEQQFPALKELSLFGYSFVNRNVYKFMKFNPQIKSLSSLHSNSVSDGAYMVAMIDKHLPRLEKLGLWIHGQEDVIPLQPRFLKALKHLKIYNYGNSANLQHLSISNESLEVIELALSYCDENLIDFIGQYKEITKLAIRMHSGSPIGFRFLPKLKQHPPKLTELEVCGSWKDVNLADILYIVHFVYGSKSLVKFILRSGKWIDILDDMVKIQKKLDSARWTVNYSALPPQLNFVRVERPVN